MVYSKSGTLMADTGLKGVVLLSLVILVMMSRLER